MARRSVAYDFGVREYLQDPEDARQLFTIAMEEEGLSLQHVLGTMVRALGVKEFAAKARMAPPNVLRAINPRHNPTLETLDRLLKPFGLRIGLAPLVPVKTKRRRGRLGKDGTRS